MPAVQSFAALVVDGMAQRRLTVTMLAARAKIDDGYLVHITKGERLPETVVLWKLAEALNWTLAERGSALNLVAAERAGVAARKRAA